MWLKFTCSHTTIQPTEQQVKEVIVVILNLVVYIAALEETELCDSYFIFCLRPLNTPHTQRGCGTPNITSEVALNNASIDFTQPTFLGIINPFHLNASGPWQVSISHCGHYN